MRGRFVQIALLILCLVVAVLLTMPRLVDEDLNKVFPLLVSYKAQIQVAVVAAGFGHLFDSRPGLHLGFVADSIFHVFPFPQKFMHLQVIEDGFAEGVDTAEQGERSRGVSGNQGVENHPFAAFAQIVFEFNYHGHTGRNVAVLGRSCPNRSGY